MAIFQSSKIIWYVMSGNPVCDDWITIYCADGDGIVQVVVYPDRIELQDQLKICKTWQADADISTILENAQNYLAATYHDIYTDAQHTPGEDSMTIYRID
jgi:hypothetical protein